MYGLEGLKGRILESMDVYKSLEASNAQERVSSSPSDQNVRRFFNWSRYVRLVGGISLR